MRMSESENSNDRPQKRNRRDGPVFGEVWDYVIRHKKVNPGHYKAECHHCGNVWQRGKPCILRSHLTLHCSNVPEDIRHYWHNKLISDNNANKRDSQLPLQVSKNLNPTYVLPSQIARIENNINDELENAECLILTMEYLISLRNYSSESHMGNFIASEIVDIIEHWTSKVCCHPTDLSKIREIKMFIDQCGKIIKHFTKSPQKLALLCQGLSNMKIHSEGLESWYQTRWRSLYDTTNSILLARPVFDW
ncbi:12703_t:CDS:2, partial [Gigaspora margarita]